MFDNAKEAVATTAGLQSIAADVAISPDGKTAYAAERNLSLVEVVNTTTGAVTPAIPVPSAARLVEGPKGHKLLAFADDPHSLTGPTPNAFFLIATPPNT